MNKRIRNIAKRAENYAEMGELPAELEQLLSKYYINDVGYLLGEVDRLKANEKQLLEICGEMNQKIETLRAQNEALANKLRETVEKFDLRKEIFSPPRDSVISETSNKTRVTDNRTP